MPEVAADACKMSIRWKKRPKLRRLNETELTVHVCVPCVRLCMSIIEGNSSAESRREPQRGDVPEPGLRGTGVRAGETPGLFPKMQDTTFLLTVFNVIRTHRPDLNLRKIESEHPVASTQCLSAIQ